jgi:lambda repressor-like predicted transcriptional regulator
MERLARNSERRSEIDHERELAAIRAESRALIWTGTQEEFVEAILKWYEAGCIQALDSTDALIKAAAHFVRPDGTAIVRPKSASSLVAPAELAEKPKPSREEFVKAILEAKGWSIFDWANEANVSHATAIDYLHGKTKPHPSTRLKLATALGITSQQLPM